MFLVFTRQDGSATAIPVNGMSEVRVQTWTPAVFGDGATLPRMVEDQTVALNDVVGISLGDDVHGAELQVSVPTVEPISEAAAAALEAQYETVPAPWEND